MLRREKQVVRVSVNLSSIHKVFNSELHSKVPIELTCIVKLASLSGPTQLSIACSVEKVEEEYWYLFSRE